MSDDWLQQQKRENDVRVSFSTRNNLQQTFNNALCSSIPWLSITFSSTTLRVASLIMRNYPHLAAFSRLPTEVVDEIAKYVAVCELKALCLVSKQTGDVATRRLYHTICLTELKGSVGCLQTLVMRRDVARCVRRLTMYVFWLSFTSWFWLQNFALLSSSWRSLSGTLGIALLSIFFGATGNQSVNHNLSG